MSTIENPLAFPFEDVVRASGQIEFGSPGMTLRDYFAIRFAVSVYAQSHGLASGFAKEAYRLADAMLEARCEKSKLYPGATTTQPNREQEGGPAPCGDADSPGGSNHEGGQP